MALLDAFRPRGGLAGVITFAGLPECKQICVSVGLFRARSAGAPLPHGGHPSGSACRDVVPVRDAEDPDDKPLRFDVQRPVGHYHVQVSVIAIREVDGSLYAQVERFFPLQSACRVAAGMGTAVELTVEWPSTPIKELPVYGTVYPRTGVRHRP